MNIQLFEYNNTPMEFEMINGEVFANATVMCKHFNKRTSDWVKLPNTKLYIKALQESRKSNVNVEIGMGDNLPFENNTQTQNHDSLIYSKNGNTGGTWVHEKLIIKLAQWLNVDFEIWCNTKIAELLKTGTVSLQPKGFTLEEALEVALTSVRTLRVRDEHIKVLDAYIEVLEPKAKFYDELLRTDAGIKMDEACKQLGLSHIEFMNILRTNGWLQINNTPTKELIKRGHLKLSIRPNISSTGTINVMYNTLITESGMSRLVDVKKEGRLIVGKIKAVLENPNNKLKR